MLEGPRAVLTHHELEACVNLANSIFYPDGSGKMGDWFPVLFDMKNAERLRIFSEEGRPVALAGFVVRDALILGSRHTCALVGSVCTAAEYQGKGLASALMEDIMKLAREEGADIVLISGSRRLYRRMGGSDAGLYRVVHVQKGAALPSLQCTVGQWRAAEIPEMAALYQAEPVRFVRSADEMTRLLESRALQCKPSRTWTMSRRATVAAYACVQDPVDQDGVSVLKIREFAGSRLALLAGLERVFQEYPAVERVDIDASASDVNMADLALSYGFATEARGFMGTMKILNATRFVDSIREYVDERLSREEAEGLTLLDGERMRIRYGGEEYPLPSDADVAALLFGTVERRPAPQVPRVISAVCAKLFPMPLIDYGLSYI